MTDFVLDASAAAAWFLPDEASTSVQTLLDRTIGSDVVVPFHFIGELGAALFRAHRLGRILQAQLLQVPVTLEELGLRTDLDGAGRVWAHALPLALAHGIGLYDAIYLELSLRLGASLATFDRALRGAAERAGVVLVL